MGFPCLLTTYRLTMDNGQHDLPRIMAELETLRRRVSEYESLSGPFWRDNPILENCIDGFCVFDQRGNILDANRAATDILGYSVEELRGLSVPDLETIESPEDINRRIAKIIETHSDRFQTKVRRKDGRVIDIDVSAGYFKSGTDEFFFDFFRDITSLNVAQEVLRENEEKYRTLVEMFPHAIAIFQDNVAVFANAAAARMLGCENSSDLTDMDVLKPVPEHDKQRLFDFMIRRMQGDTSDAIPLRATLMRSDGTEFPVEVYSTRISFGGRPALQNVIIDISDREEAMRALRVSEIKYRTVIEQINAVTYTAIPNAKSATIFCSPQIKALTGFSADEMLADQSLWFKRLHPDDKERVSVEMASCYGAGKPLSIEYRLIAKDGRIVWIKDEAIVSPGANGATGIVHGVMLDITRLKEAEEKLKASESRYRDLFESLTSGYVLCEIVTDDSGKPIDYIFLEVNKAFERMSSKSAREVIGRRVTEIFPLVAQTDLIEICGQVALTGKPASLDREALSIGRLLETSIFSPRRGQFASVFTDITERRRAEELLRKSQEAYREMIENINDVIYTCDKDGIITYVSPVLQKVLGYTPSELVGKSFDTVICDDDLPEIRRAYDDLLKNIIYPSEYRIIAKSGEVRWVRTSSRPVIENGEVTGIRGVLVDITERKRVEAALRESEEFGRAVIEHSPLGVSVRSRTGKLLSCNKAWQRIWNRTEKEIDALLNDNPRELKFDHRDYYLKDWHSKITEVYRRGGYLHIPEVRILYRREGAPYWVSQHFYAIKDSADQVDRVIILTEDISERKLAEEALRESEERYRAIWENSPVGICLSDRDGVYHYVNQTYCDIYGFTKEELIGHSFQELIMPPGHPKAEKEEYARLFDSPKSVRLGESEFFIKKEGKPVYIQYTSDFVMQNGVPKYLVAMNIDITEKKKALDALKLSEENYRLLIENAGEVIANIDKDGRFLLVNRAAAGFFGRTPSDIIGKTLWDLFPREGAGMYENGVLHVMRTGQAIIKEAQYTIRGELKWFRTNLQPIRNSSGEVASVLILSADITKHKQIETRNQARLKLLQNFRQAENVDECLKFGCQAIFDAQLFKRAVLTLHNQDRVIVNLGQIGLDESIITAARAAPAPDQQIAAKITQMKYKTSHSFFIPCESGIVSAAGQRVVPQEEAGPSGRDAWKNGDELFSPIMGKENNYEGWLSVDTPFDGRRPALETVLYLEEILDITAKQVHELQSLEKLRLESQALYEKNITLRQVLDHIEDDKMELRQKIGATVSQVLIPALEKLFKKDGSINQTYFNILKSGLPQLVSASGAVIHLYSRLSPREREICNMIKSGATSKEIAESLNISLATVRKHRELIRRKLEISNKNINLITYLDGA